PDHVAISAATTLAVERRASGDVRLFYSHFPRSRLALRERLAGWLIELGKRFRGSTDFALALSLFAEESATMGFASDDVDVRWYPPGFAIVEQGEPSTALYLILSGEAKVIHEDAHGSRKELARLGTGEFFGELGVAGDTPRNAHVTAVTSVTCLVLTAEEPGPYAGRGADARLLGSTDDGDGTTARVSPSVAAGHSATAVIDVGSHVDAKIAAIAAHRSQFPIDPAMFPPGMLASMYGTEYFLRIAPPFEPETDLLG
ncbi:MAG: cyclic nucleotide-binding domain-containing protein, partial [Actinomycetota bacterium]|nr:cyclic nucleotide-binding domain-containing protein [Actinomycetota bacterium]